jgi:hypothetical protein
VTHKEPQDVKKTITGLAAALGTIPVPIAAAMLLMVVLPYPWKSLQHHRPTNADR